MADDFFFEIRFVVLFRFIINFLALHITFVVR